ncbi:hypothetical protein NYE71_31975 [Bacillus sp. FSL K6-0273]|uniref:hypothetical protein n=1 Tax=Bacillus sp. FSL K6-0273 TaxID=2975328 RepID=UPI0030F54836
MEKKKKSKKAKIVQIEINGILLDAKMCNKCEVVKILDLFPKEKSGIGGRRSFCKECYHQRKREYRQENKEIMKELDRKHYMKKRERTLEQKQVYYRENKDVILKKRKEFHQKNKEKLNKISRIYYMNNKKEQNEYRLKWQRENREKVCQYKNTYKAKKAALYYNITDEEILKIFDMFNGCAFSDETIGSLDHFVALSTGHCGTYIENSISLCKELNSSKKNLNPFEWSGIKDEVDIKKFNRVVLHLAKLNCLTFDEYKGFVYWCYENQRTEEQIKSDKRHSIEIWRNTTKRQLPLPKFAFNSIL